MRPFFLRSLRMSRRALNLPFKTAFDGGMSSKINLEALEKSGLKFVTRVCNATLEKLLTELAHVTRTYNRDEFEVRALDDVTLDIPRKSFVAIMGPSGSGKTTLLNLVTGIDHATSGRVAVGGEEISTMNEREIAAWRARHIGLV